MHVLVLLTVKSKDKIKIRRTKKIILTNRITAKEHFTLIRLRKRLKNGSWQKPDQLVLLLDTMEVRTWEK